MSKKVIVYCICDPATNEVRYVGRTTQELNRRASQHNSTAKRKSNHRECWLNSILCSGAIPVYYVLDEVCLDNWVDAEKFWIEYLRFLGANLTNSTAGGDGITSYKHTEMSKEKMSKAQRGRKHSEETKAKIAAASSKYKHSEETKAKLAEKAKNRSAEHRKNGFPDFMVDYHIMSCCSKTGLHD